MSTPVYFELSWSILSTIGLANVFLGLLVVGITNFSPIVIVPIAASAACAVANGLCYYAFYATYPLQQTVVAAAFGDAMWLIQEAGLSFYGYQILIRVLSHRSHATFLYLFWIIITIISDIRAMILITRVVLQGSPAYLQKRVDMLHIGYFTSIAVIEIISSFFLLCVFSAAKSSSLTIVRKSGLFRQLMRSTEIHPVSRRHHPCHHLLLPSSHQMATSAASQVDRFAYTLERIFPLVMLIDITASKLARAQCSEDNSSTQIRHGNLHGGDSHAVPSSLTGGTGS